jgi:hypothetical protein
MATFITVLTGGYGHIELNLDLVRYIHAQESGKAVIIFDGGDHLVTSESLEALSQRLPGPGLGLEQCRTCERPHPINEPHTEAYPKGHPANQR